MRLHLVDGTFELFRAHYSKRPDERSPAGQDVKATLGIVSSILWLLEDPAEQATHVAVAFDNPIRSFRNDLFDGYKSDEGVDPALRAQFDLAEEAMRAIGVVVWSMDRWEADDALATGAKRWRDAVDQVRILSPDKDLGQCLTGDRVVLVDRIRSRVIDEPALRAAKGVAPESIPDLLALTGDSADGIPGLPGIGDKTAASLLGRYVHLESIPADPAAWTGLSIRGASRVAAALVHHAEEARLYKRLATLIDDVPLAEDLAALEHTGVPRDRFEAWCRDLGATKLLDRPKRWGSGPRA